MAASSGEFPSIASELEILPEALVFVDDNPAEREIVRQQVDGAAVPEITIAGNENRMPERYIQILDKNGYFEVTSLSEDDRKRNEMYRANVVRKQEAGTFADYHEYLRSLDMVGTIKAFEPIYMARIAQLTNKSNQFNLTTRRFSQSEIEQMASAGGYLTLYGKLVDKFGDNGVVSVVIGKQENELLHLELWLMSCRVLKRDMEFAMMDRVVEECQAKGITTIKGYYYPTAKNAMVKDFYQLQGFNKIEEDEVGNAVWEFAIPTTYECKNKVITVNSQ